jgi:hypothetical protein
VTGGASEGTTDTSRLWVQVRLSQSDLDKVDRGLPARILPISDDVNDDEDGTGLEGEPDAAVDAGNTDDIGDDEDDVLYYLVDNSDQRLVPAQSVFVDLPISAEAVERLVVPYAAVVYGLEGETWVYTNPEPLVFVREPIVVDYIEGDQAYLTEGPPTGTNIVTVGVAELFGTETGVSK